MTTKKTPGQQAYEADVAAKPEYHDGAPRPSWAMLSEWAQKSWENNPQARSWEK